MWIKVATTPQATVAHNTLSGRARYTNPNGEHFALSLHDVILFEESPIGYASLLKQVRRFIATYRGYL